MIIRGGCTGQPEYRFPKLIQYRPPYFVGGNKGSIGVGDVLEFSDEFITISVYTYSSVAREGFELEIAPLAGKTLESHYQSRLAANIDEAAFAGLVRPSLSLHGSKYIPCVFSDYVEAEFERKNTVLICRATWWWWSDG